MDGRATRRGGEAHRSADRETAGAQGLEPGGARACDPDGRVNGVAMGARRSPRLCAECAQTGCRPRRGACGSTTSGAGRADTARPDRARAHPSGCPSRRARRRDGGRALRPSRRSRKASADASSRQPSLSGSSGSRLRASSLTASFAASYRATITSSSPLLRPGLLSRSTGTIDSFTRRISKPCTAFDEPGAECWRSQDADGSSLNTWTTIPA